MNKKIIFILFALCIFTNFMLCSGSSDNAKAKDDELKSIMNTKPEEPPEEEVPMEYAIKITKSGIEIKFGFGPQLNKTKDVLKIPKDSSIDINLEGKGKYEIKVGEDGKYETINQQKYTWKKASSTLFIKSGKKIYKIVAL